MSSNASDRFLFDLNWSTEPTSQTFATIIEEPSLDNELDENDLETLAMLGKSNLKDWATEGFSDAFHFASSPFVQLEGPNGERRVVKNRWFSFYNNPPRN